MRDLEELDENAWRGCRIERADLARRLCAFIDDWRDETFRGSPLVAQSTHWALLDTAIMDLKARIVAHI